MISTAAFEPLLFLVVLLLRLRDRLRDESEDELRLLERRESKDSRGLLDFESLTENRLPSTSSITAVEDSESSLESSLIRGLGTGTIPSGTTPSDSEERRRLLRRLFFFEPCLSCFATTKRPSESLRAVSYTHLTLPTIYSV